MNQTHPLVDAYLDRLTALLAGTDAATRGEVLAGVREHLHDRLGADADDARVRAVLTELGTPEQIADEAHAGPQATGSPTARSRDGRWLPAVVMVLGGLITLLLAFFTATGPHLVEIFFALFYPPLWPVLVVLVVVARGWTGREKALLIGVLPAACTLVSVVAGVSWGISPAVGAPASIAALVVAVVTSLAVLVVLGRRGLARAR